MPFLLMTNGGGVTEAERLTALSKDFDIEVCVFGLNSVRG